MTEDQLYDTQIQILELVHAARDAGYEITVCTHEQLLLPFGQTWGPTPVVTSLPMAGQTRVEKPVFRARPTK